MAGFNGPEHYVPLKSALLPLRFERRADGDYFVANIVGDIIRLTESELSKLIEGDVIPGDGLYERAYSAHLIAPPDEKAKLQLLALRLRSRYEFLSQSTALHIFVVTLRCEHSCPYCQVSRQNTDKQLFDMSQDTAEKALAIALQSPTQRLKIEFQGGEPLLNFELIKWIVCRAKELARPLSKVVDFVIASNLALLDDDILAFCKTHDILLSTSLDGPADLHNKNRPRPGGNSHELAVRGIKRAQEYLGRDCVGALMTTSESSLPRARDIIDAYLELDLDGIFLRPLSPYGFAVKTKWIRKYDARRWLSFYEEGLEYILDINRTGRRFPEFYAGLILQRMLTDQPTSYVDLRSPAGAGLGALIYNYDGRIFASDEGRMLAEMDDDAFELGHVDRDTFRSILLSDRLLELVGRSLTQTAPACSDCAFEAHCGADPVYHHATQGDVLGIKPISEFCARQKGVMTLLLDKLMNNPDDAKILRSWVRH